MVIPFPLRPVLLLVTIYYLNFLSRVILAPMLPLIENEIGLGHGEAGSLFLFITGGYGVGLLGSTFISSRLNHRRTVLLSAVTVGGALLALSRSASMPGMHLGLFATGIAAGFYVPSGIAILTEQVSREHWGKAMALNELAPTLALITAPLLAEALLGFVLWRNILAIVGIGSILMGGLFYVCGQGGHQKGERPNPIAVQRIVASPSFWIMSAVVGLSVGASVGVYTMLPLFLVNEVGFDRAFANAVIGSSRVFGVVIVLLSGMITDRIGHKRGTISFFAILGVLTFLLGTIRGPVATPALIVLQATSIPCFFAAAFAMISSLFPSHLRSMAVSFLVLIGFVFGAGVVPPAIGYLAEVLSFSFGFSLIGVAVLAVLPLLFYLESGTREIAVSSGGR